MSNAPNHHDERYEKLESLSDWELENKDQDIRGRPLVDAQGKRLGVIDDLLVDKDGERVAAVRLDDGSTCGVENLVIQANQVMYRARVAGAAGAAVPPRGDGKRTDKGDDQRVDVVEEDVAIDKRAVEGDTIRLRTRVASDKVSEDVKLRDENVDVSRRPADRQLGTGEADKLFKDRTISATEHDEEAVVAKTARVKEEVVLSKNADERTEHVDETARHTEVDVDRSKADRDGQGKEGDVAGKPRR